RTVLARTSSGAAFVLVSLFAVYGTYIAVSSVSGAQARSVIAVPQVQSTQPVIASIQPAPAASTAAGSVHYQTTGQTRRAAGALPAPIAPPIGELARLPKPAALDQTELNPTGGQDPNAEALEIKPSAQTPKRKAIKKRPIRKKKSAPAKPKSIIAKPAKPVTFSTVDSASAPAPARQLQGDTSQRNGSNFSAKSIGCSGRNCGEVDDNR
ncbi:MAG: hypothetical protein AAGF81_05560, partial [Pseudomonadota bacterium]